MSHLVTEVLLGFVRNRDRPVRNGRFKMPTFDGGGEPIDSMPSDLHKIEESTEFARFNDEAV